MIPLIKISNIALPNENANPNAPPRIEPTIEFSPIPDAWARGILASKAINKVPITAPRAVAINTDDQRASSVPSNNIELGLTVKM